MERQIAASGKVQREENNKEEEDLSSKQVSDELEKSCLTEEEEDDDYLSDENSKKRTRMVKTTSDSESTKRKKRKPSKEPRYENTLSFDDWLFVGTPKNKATNHKEAIKIDDEDMNKRLERSSCGDCFFPKAQCLPQVGIYSLPYTVMF